MRSSVEILSLSSSVAMARTETRSSSKDGEGPSQLFIFARFYAKNGKEAALAEDLRTEVLAARRDPGCIAHSAYRSVRDSRLFFIHSRWRDDAAFEEHLKLPHTLQFAERVESLIDHQLEVIRARPLET